MIPVRQIQSVDEMLDSLLLEWYEHFRGYTLTKGHRTASATTADYSTPTHHDWRNGAEDDRAEKLRKKWLNECMEAVPNHPHRWRTVLEMHARNLHSGASVWGSLVLPKDKNELEILLIEARNKLLLQLKRKDLI